MSKLSQHSAVVQVTKAHFGEKFVPGCDVKDYATKADKQAIASKIAEMMIEGTVELSDHAMAKYGESAEVLTSKYVVGMVTNWFNKSKDLNGGVKYETKNPGSRAGGGDAQIREMRILRKQLEATGNTEGVTRVDQAIAERIAELRATSTPTVEINTENLPEYLRDLA
jgi:hypothetical protein